MPIRVQLDYALLRRLRKVESAALADLGPVVRNHAGLTVALSQALVPVGEKDTDGRPPLSSTDFLDGPVINRGRGSVSATGGYAHPAAGPIHEGFHWGQKLFDAPPHFLRKPAKALRRECRKAVAKQIKQTLARLFPST